MENLIRYQVLGDDSTRFLLKLDSKEGRTQSQGQGLVEKRTQRSLRKFVQKESLS